MILNTQSKCIGFVKQVIECVNFLFNLNFGLPSIKFNEHLDKNKIAGRAIYETFCIELNSKEIERSPAHFYKIIIHEIAHLVTSHLYLNPKPHGKEFFYINECLNENIRFFI